MLNANNGLISTFTSNLEDGDVWYDIPFANWEDDYKNKVNESVVSDYTLDQIKRVLDSEETEYGYSLKITNSGADAETKTLDLDKEDLQAIYDALSKNKVTESKKDDRFQANLSLHSKFGIDKGSKLIQELDTALEQNDKQKIKKLANKFKKELSPNDYTSFIKTYYPKYKEVLESVFIEKECSKQS